MKLSYFIEEKASSEGLIDLSKITYLSKKQKQDHNTGFPISHAKFPPLHYSMLPSKRGRNLGNFWSNATWEMLIRAPIADTLAVEMQVAWVIFFLISLFPPDIIFPKNNLIWRLLILSIHKNK